MREDLFKGISEELINKAKACKNPEEIMALAKEEGIELTEEQLAAVSGGYCLEAPPCPYCGSTNTCFTHRGIDVSYDKAVWCYDCNRQSPYNPPVD